MENQMNTVKFKLNCLDFIRVNLPYYLWLKNSSPHWVI